MFTFILVLLLSFNNTIVVSANTETTYFARIIQDGTFLFKTPTEVSDSSNIYFELPKTYFVQLIDKVDNIFYKVTYSSFTGYVKKDNVQAVKNPPVSPYLENINFRVYAEISRDLRSQPNLSNSNQIAHIPLLSKNITYFGKISGECLIDGRTNIWYYCKYSADKDYYGYVYSDFCDEMTPIKTNTEEVTFIENPSFEPVKGQTYTIPENSKITGIIIGILSIPALIFLLLIVKGKHIISKEKFKDKEVIDY